MKEYMTAKQLSVYLGVDPATIYRWRVSFGMPYHELVTGKKAYKVSEVEDWLLQRNSKKEESK